MPSLPQSDLHGRLRSWLSVGTVFTTDQSIHPAEAAVPEIGDIRIYLWTVTHVESADRPQDEYKIQLTLPGPVTSRTNRLDLSKRLTFLLGYSPDFGVFVGWQAELHERFGFSSAVQVKESTLAAARVTGWAVAPPRRAGSSEEVRVAFSPGNLMHFLKTTVQADRKHLIGKFRELFFLGRTPNTRGISLPAEEAGVTEAINRIRTEQTVRRLERDAKFGPLVKGQFNFACAVCGVQLGIIEGAHIIPVNVEHSEDKIWNGLALCRNHHKLFDAYALLISPELKIGIDEATIEYYRESGQGSGIDSVLTAFHGQDLARPRFYMTDPNAAQKLVSALQWRAGRRLQNQEH